MLPSLLSLTLLEELPWSDSPFPAVGSTAPLLTGGMLSWCHSVLLVDIMKDAEMSLSSAAEWTTWQRTAVSFLLSAYCFFLEETGTQDPSQGPFLEDDMDIKLPSIYSPLAVSHQPLLLQRPLFCAQSKSLASVQAMTLQSSSTTLMSFQALNRCRININSRMPQRAREDQGQVL